MGSSKILALGVLASSALGAIALGACGAMLDIRPDADAGATGDGSTDGSASDGQSSNDAGPDGPGCATFLPSGKIVFVSEPWTPGGDLAAADIACNTSAAHAGYCQRTFVAFLGTSTALPHRRLPPDGGPWVHPVGGAVVFDSERLMEVANVVPHSPIDQLADGGSVDPNATVWTGAHAQLGLANADQTCNDWKSPPPSAGGIIGTPATVPPTAEWIEKQGTGGTVPCASAYPILCFEQ